MLSMIFDAVFGSISQMQWYIIAGIAAFAAFLGVLWFTGNRQIAWLAATLLGATVAILGARAANREAGRKAAIARIQKDAEQRAVVRERVDNEVGTLSDGDLDKRAAPWVRDDIGDNEQDRLPKPLV